VVMLWHRAVSPPDSTGPFDTAYEAALASRPELNGWGRSEEAAIEALGERLRALASGPPVSDPLPAAGQALVAAQTLGVDEFARWLLARTERLQLA
jgi:hypothetical protein